MGWACLGSVKGLKDGRWVDGSVSYRGSLGWNDIPEVRRFSNVCQLLGGILRRWVVEVWWFYSLVARLGKSDFVLM